MPHNHQHSHDKFRQHRQPHQSLNDKGETPRVPLLNSYKLYKAGTKKLIEWLASTASRCCDIKTIVQSCGASLKRGSSTTDGRCEVEIRTREVLKLAEVVATSEPPVAIPSTIIDIAKDVIAGREECADWYAAQALQGGSGLEEENETHRYFILVLRKVSKLLIDTRAKRPTTEAKNECSKNATKKKSGKASVPSAQTQELQNLFDCLVVEEPSASPLGESTNSDLVPTSKSVKDLDFKLAKEDDDLAFAIWCFLQDLQDVRRYVNEIWLEYSRGETSFFTASSVTDAAFGLLRAADEQFVRSTVQSTDDAELLHYLGLTFFTRGQAVWLCPLKPGSKPRIPDSDVNVTELLCPIARMCLVSYIRDARNLCQWAQHTALDTGVNGGRPKPSGFYRYDHFCGVLYQLAPELNMIAHTDGCEHVVLDEFVQGLVKMHRTDRTPTWMVVVCQIYLDIYDLLGCCCGHGSDALGGLLVKNREIADGLEKYRVQSENGMADVQGAVRMFRNAAKGTNRFEEIVWNVSEKRSRDDDNLTNELRELKKPGIGASLLERMLPAHAGAIFADLKIGMYIAGCKIANHRHAVLSMAHLYKAFRSRGLLKTDWHDMDLVLASFGSGKQSLVTKHGSKVDPEAMARHYALALGVPATDFAMGGRRTKGRLTPTKEARQLDVTSPLLQGMRARSSGRGAAGEGYNAKTTIDAVLWGLLTATSKTDENKLVRRPSHLRDSFTPTQLLRVFRKTLVADEPQLNFNYTGFTLDCVKLLDDIAAEVAPLLELQDSMSDWHFTLVSWLIKSTPGHRALQIATKLIQEHIEATGKKFVKQAYDQSSGRIPKHLRPDVDKTRRAKQDEEDNTAITRTMLDYAGTKYSFSGSSIAAYHPGIVSECCTGDGHHEGETDPGHANHPHKPIVAWGSAIPKAIVDLAIAGANANPDKMYEASDKSLISLFKNQAKGLISDAQLRRYVRAITGFGIVQLLNVPKEVVPWAFVVHPFDSRYEDQLADYKKSGLKVKHGQCLVIPVDERLPKLTVSTKAMQRMGWRRE